MFYKVSKLSTETRLLVSVFFIVVSFCLVSVFQLLEDDSSLTRLPSSVSGGAEVLEPVRWTSSANEDSTANNQAFVLQKDLCEHKNLSQETSRTQNVELLQIESDYVFFKGQVCPTSQDTEIEISNLSNGYTASVLTSSEKGIVYQTDLIKLNQGENKILISLKRAHRTETRTLKIMRQATKI